MASVIVALGQSVASGSAHGEALAADIPLSFWGGFDPETGLIIDRSHPARGASLAGLILGAGGVGLSSVMGASLVGANPIVVSDVDPGKLELARRLGAKLAVTEAS